jgi:UDP-3-O-[3-hydroxymyristoyl] N-acetylglucosamine deacetylase
LVPAEVRLEGFALHAGTECAVTLARHDGPITFGRGPHRVPLEKLCVARTDFGVRLADGSGFEVDLVEHLLAALGGLGVRRGLVAVVEGPELPLLDGGARSLTDAIARLGVASAAPMIAVAKAARIEDERSSYLFEPGDAVEVEVEVRFEHPAIGAQRAHWDGTPSSFRDDIAPARTFGFAGQAADLASRGRARLAITCEAKLREAVIVFDDGPVPRMTENEVARHKLLDLVGDLAFYGGPPLGRIVAQRPGHTATHRIVRHALASGILSRR